MHRAYDPALRLGINPVRQLSQCFINPPPEGDTVCNRGRFGHRAEVGDKLVEDLTVDAAGLHQTALKPGGGLAKAGEHGCSGITLSLSQCISSAA